jgi:hypothetical protein
VPEQRVVQAARAAAEQSQTQRQRHAGQTRMDHDGIPLLIDVRPERTEGANAHRAIMRQEGAAGKPT